MAGQTHYEKNVLFYDRLVNLIRLKEAGSPVSRGGDEGGVKLRILQGNQGRGCYLKAHLGSLNVLLSNIRNYPETVTPDGTIISIYLLDTANGRDPYQRLFELEFFDEMAAKAFFEIYCSSLPDHVDRGESFDDLRHRLHRSTTNPRHHLDVERAEVHGDDTSLDGSGNEEEEGGATGEQGEGDLVNVSDDDLFDDFLFNNENPPPARTNDNDEEDSDEEDSDETDGDETDNDDIPIELLELGNYGESQDLYNPIRPFGNNRYH